MNGLLKNPLGFLAGCLSLALFLPLAVEANNLRVSNITLTNTLKKAGTTDIMFDLSWENSWRASWTEDDTGAGNAPQTVTNWDAAWVFIKYRLREGANTNWRHACLAEGGHMAPEGITITPGDTDGDNVGAFIHRSVNGHGNLVISGLRLRWAYASQGLQYTDALDISVQAIEMVYVPAGPFYVGDGRVGRVALEAGTSGLPFRITNEFYEITLGGGGEDSMGNQNKSGIHTSWHEDFDYTTSQTLPATFPKGFDAFYCMKYEITQEQYKNFLNTLTRDQQKALVHASGTNASYYALTGTPEMTDSRLGIRCPDEVGEGPITFGCDFNGNGIFNEEGDGQDMTCNPPSEGTRAYLDWAGLRPMTEFEFEKACRGPKYPVMNEYAWGTNTGTRLTGFSGLDGSGTELPTPVAANINYYDFTTYYISRAGIFATTSSDRIKAGAGYYGVMELSGSLGERVVTVSLSGGRGFTGVHGDGVLAANGQANVPNWPLAGGDGRGWGIRGGIEHSTQVSDRFLTAFHSQRASGNRGVRTVP